MTNLGNRLRVVSANFPHFSLLNFHLPASAPSAGSCLSQYSGRWFSKPGFLSFSALLYLGCKTRSLYVMVTYYSLMMSVWAHDSCFVWWPKGYYHHYRCLNCPRLHSRSSFKLAAMFSDMSHCCLPQQKYLRHTWHFHWSIWWVSPIVRFDSRQNWKTEIWVHTYTHILIHACTCVYMYICTHVCVSMCKCIWHMYIIHIYVCV